HPPRSPSITALDFGAWRPLSRWAEKFRYDQTPSTDDVPTVEDRYRSARLQRAASFVSRGLRSGASRVRAPWALISGRHRKPSPSGKNSFASTAIKYVVLGAILVVVWLILIALIVSAYQLFTAPILPSIRQQMLELPAAMGTSVLRVVAAFLISLSIALPLSIYFARVSSRASRYGLPVVEVIASFPATALFPVIIFELLPYLTGEGAAILMLMTGMMWYLLFNLL
ncbi:binding-protein-dependent transport system inner membrane component, partial [mine drainage metagenome]